MNNKLSEKCIVDSLNKHFGIEVITLTFLPLGADRNASVYRAETRERLSYFVKIKSDFSHHSTVIMELLYQAGIKQIISSVKTLHNQSFLSLNDFTIVVYPFIDGQDGFNRSLSDDHWLILGKALRQIHDINVSQSIQSHIRLEIYSPKWRKVLQSMISPIQADPVGDEIAIKLWGFMNKHLIAIQRLLDRAESLAKKLHNEPAKFVLCHSDLHGGNIFFDETNNLYIVDWDDPIMAPKERDLMFIGGGVGNIWNKPCEEELFYEGYGKAEVNKTAMAYYRHERIVEDIAIYCQEVFFTTAEIKDKLQMYEHFIGMFEPRGVVEIAFETDPTT